MHVITAVLTLALLQGDPDARALRDKIERLEKRLPELDFKIRLAVREERFEDAQRHTQDYQDLELEIAQAKEKVEQMKAKAPPRLQWYKNIHVEGQGRHTWWDNELGLGDGIGWGIEVSFRDFLTLEYRRWETDDDLMRGDAEIQAYMVGVTQEFSLSQEHRTAFQITGSAGWIDFDSAAPAGDDDLGLMFTLRPEWKHYISDGLRLNAGGDIDILRTDFNQRHHHTRYDFSILLSIELAF